MQAMTAQQISASLLTMTDLVKKNLNQNQSKVMARTESENITSKQINQPALPKLKKIQLEENEKQNALKITKIQSKKRAEKCIKTTESKRGKVKTISIPTIDTRWQTNEHIKEEETDTNLEE